MAIVIQNTNYNGEVLEQLLTLAATGNELVEKGLIRLEPGVSEKFSIPRIKTGKMLQKRKEMPEDSDSKGNFNYSEKVLKPVDFMAFTTFNPRSFEKVWRKWQPKGNLVFAELPAEAQNALLSEMAKTVKFELGWHFINGEYEDGDDDDKLFNGIIFRMKEDDDTIVVLTSSRTMIGKFKMLQKNIPFPMRSATGLKIICSIKDFDRYDDELTAQPNKGANWTDTNAKRFKGINIEPLANWPDGCPVATITGMDTNTNLWGAVNLQDDMDVIQIDKLTNAGERYFFKMLMKADTNIAFGEEVVMLEKVAASLEVEPTELEFQAEGGNLSVTVEATEEFKVTEISEGFSFDITDDGVTVTADDNTAGAGERTGTMVISLAENTSKKVTITLTQPTEG